MGMGSTGVFPWFPYLYSSSTKAFDSTSKCDTYVSTEGRLRADAAPFLRLFRESLYGEVPIVVPAVLETIYRGFVSLATEKRGGEQKKKKKDKKPAYDTTLITNLMESISFGPRAQSLCILTEKYFCRRSRVDHDDGDVPQLDLINGAVLFRPEAILLGGICANLGQVSNQRQSARTLHTLDAGGITNELVKDDIEDGGEDGCGG
jgi:hypothetical protein